ncbi:MAG: UDP-3-O-(3-hydroxymyristoyl)glucosamine N-acyltransferase [Bacteroidales bacterium]|nr:UDP-3-O-(3-hydroxymyristoyl)glucosamine N-acyltransferase [Bacteroidales bacterium]
MELSAKQIADFLQGTTEGNSEVTVNKVCKIEEGEPGGLSFLANPKYAQYIYSTEASAVIVNEDFVLEKPINATLIKVKDAYSAFASLLELYNQYRFNRKGISSLAFVNDSAKVGEDCYLGEYAVIDKDAVIGTNCRIYPQVYIGEGVKIGNNVTIYAGAKIYHDVVIGNNCIIHSGVVIGADGFGFAPLSDGTFKKIPQTGNVIIEDDAEIGANACIDRSTMGSTVIHKGAKIDNLCQIAHNVTVGSNTVMSAQTGLAGSTQIGNNCFIGGQVGFAGHIKIGDNVQIGAQSGVMSNVKDNSRLFGSPAINPTEYMRAYALFKKLPEMEKRLRELENKLTDTSN